MGPDGSRNAIKHVAVNSSPGEVIFDCFVHSSDCLNCPGRYLNVEYVRLCDRRYGLIQICYSDGVDAENWKNWIIDGKLEYVLMEELKKLFSKRCIEKPSKLMYQYWWHGTHYTYPTYNSNEIYKKMLNPIENIYIIGECYSKYQGWIEGALQTAEDCSKIIFENNFENKNMKKITKKMFDKNKEKWTIYEGHVYDISKFIKKHPGGEVIEYALGIDMTKIFNGVGHNNDAYNMLDKYKIGKLV